MELRVAIHDPRTGVDEEAFFRISPIRIGRNALNDLLLDEPSVSQWHAQLAFDEHHVWFTDVGSSNGSVVDMQRVAAHHAVAVHAETRVEVGPVVLRVSRAADGERRSRRVAMGGAMPDDLRTAISMIDVTRISGDDLATEGVGNDAQTALASSAMSQLQYLRTLLAAVEPARRAYLEVLADQIESLPSASRQKIIPQLARELPELSRLPEYVEIAARHGVDGMSVKEVTAREWLEKLAGVPLTGPHGEDVDDARVLARVAALLQTFAQSLFELMRAKEHVARELGLGSGDGVPQSGQEILAYLCDFRVDGEERVGALTRVFADLAMHQIAMVSATREGVRSLIEEISPQAVGARAKGGGLLDLLPLRGASLWDLYTRVHADLAEGDRFARHVFGARFSRAYLAITGRRAQQRDAAPPPPPPTTVPEQQSIPVTRIR
ncbi:type VI secretion system-associated FHA domain protein [Sandaracinus amylolyticus]|uniref:FHA domain-containing protein n=1 Tax=Sandaracinus amylolyticus TaxID=927083 RepID=A0A0F6W6X1_9BACT|nr:type VI secretion system-associated FHA domain protein [Sandaracinus amylolyticus]AKF08815.1 hypothetical protein DB32_005964 [Sandaracinus amylolyticus]